METCSVDFETRSTLDLRRTGVYRYAEHSDTDVWVMAYAFGGASPRVWFPGDEVPDDIFLHALAGGDFRAWNAQFERIIWNNILVPRYGFPATQLPQWWCTAAEARAMALPRSLGLAAKALGIKERKDDDGRSLMLQMARPRAPGVWWGDDERLARLVDYCRQDVIVERAIARRLRRLGKREREVYLADQRLNDRGVHLDLDLIHATQKVVALATDEANKRLRGITGGAVGKVTQVARLLEWVVGRGVDTPDLQKATLRDLLATDLPEDVREALTIRQEIGKTSAAKMNAMEGCVGEDGRARGLHLYHGATTGRWSGQLIQPQNFPRGEVKDVERYIEPILAGEPIDHEKPVVVASSLLRSMLTAAPGKRLIGGDYSQIEARVLGFFADEPYGDYEYERMGALIFGCSVEEIIHDHVNGIHDPLQRRQIGKNTVLGCGYQMGAKRYREQAQEQMGVDLGEDLAELAVATYRASKPGIVAFWSQIEAAAMDAVYRAGEPVEVGTSGIRFAVRNEFLWCVLPSGRPLAYALPRIEEVEAPWGDMVPKLTYMGVSPYTRKWERLGSYGGHLTENVVQAAARDLMADAIVRLDAAGYRPVLTVHDEVVGEVDADFGSVEEFSRLLVETPKWADGCPVEAECWEGPRYRK